MAKTEKVEVSTYEPAITIKKFFTGLLMALVPVIILYILDYLEQTDFPPEYALYIPLIVAALHATLNWLKHRKDTEIKRVPV